METQMEQLVQKKLEIIADIWNEFIWDYKFCNSRIKFTDDVRVNYFGDILHYFSDTFTVIFKKRVPKKFYSAFEGAVSFLQAIYIQQDFTEEMLSIFRCGVNKGDLKRDSSYEINREIRNELVGHPIRKTIVTNNDQNTGEQVLLSSTLFSNRLDNEQISYLRYRRENNYEFEAVTHLRKYIIDRHVKFIDFYFNIIINKLNSILKEFGKKLADVSKNIDRAPFSKVILLASHYFESIFDYSSLFKPEILMMAHDKRELHPRYINAADSFLRILKGSIAETRARINNYNTVLEQLAIQVNKDRKINLSFCLEEDDCGDKKERQLPKVSYHYELGKLSERRSQSDFDFFSSLLREKCQDKQEVLDELVHMSMNLESDFEYFCAYELIRKILKED